MAVFKPKEKKLLGKSRVVDGNAVVKANRARNAQPGSFGSIRNNTTGETVTTESNQKPQSYQIPTSKETTTASTPNTDNTAEMNDMMEQDQEYAEYAQAYEYETGRIPTYEEYQEYKEEYTAQDGSARPLKEADQTKQQITDTVGKLTDYIKQNDIKIDDIYNMMPEETDARTFDLMLNPGEIETEEEAEDVYMAIDMMADAMGIDTQKFFSTGEVAECGEECQEYRKEAMNNRTPMEEPETYKDKLARLEE